MYTQTALAIEPTYVCISHRIPEADETPHRFLRERGRIQQKLKRELGRKFGIEALTHS